MDEETERSVAVLTKRWARGPPSLWQGCNLDPTSDATYEKDIDKSGKVPKTGVNQAEDRVAGRGLEQEMCERGPREQCFLSLGERGPHHSHPGRAGGWGDSSVQLF